MHEKESMANVQNHVRIPVCVECDVAGFILYFIFLWSTSRRDFFQISYLLAEFSVYSSHGVKLFVLEKIKVWTEILKHRNRAYTWLRILAIEYVAIPLDPHLWHGKALISYHALSFDKRFRKVELQYHRVKKEHGIWRIHFLRYSDNLSLKMFDTK